MKPASDEGYGVVDDLRELVAAIPAAAKVIRLSREFGRLDVRDPDGVGIEVTSIGK